MLLAELVLVLLRPELGLPDRVLPADPGRPEPGLRCDLPPCLALDSRELGSLLPAVNRPFDSCAIGGREGDRTSLCRVFLIVAEELGEVH